MKEIVSPTLCDEALSNIKNLMIYSKEDVILFCASLNSLNTYVKQKNSDIGYGFKHSINRLFFALLQNHIPPRKEMKSRMSLFKLMMFSLVFIR